MLELNRIHNTDALSGLKKLPDESIDMVITSPPYWGLRDYGKETHSIWGKDKNCSHKWETTIVKKKSGGSPTAQVWNHQKGIGQYVSKSNKCLKCGAWKGQLGLEPDFGEYTKHLLSIFDEIKRVLKKDGTCWVNIGDTYGGSGLGISIKGHNKGKNSILPNDMSYLPKSVHIKGRWSKCLLAIPERFALGMIDRGWILRNKIIWHKPNHMPTSVKDRFANSWEYLFFFSKSRKYNFDLDAVREPHKSESIKRTNRNWNGHREPLSSFAQMEIQKMCHPKGKNLGDAIKTLSTNDFWIINNQPFKGAHFAVFPEKLIERPIKTTRKDAIILDPFMGSGTTAVVTKRLGRNFIGFDPNPEYVKIAERRINEIYPN